MRLRQCENSARGRDRHYRTRSHTNIVKCFNTVTLFGSLAANHECRKYLAEDRWRLQFRFKNINEVVAG